MSERCKRTLDQQSFSEEISRRTFIGRTGGVFLGASTLGSLIAACGGGEKTSEPAAPAPAAETAGESGLSQLPPEIQAWYEDAKVTTDISPYVDFEPVDPPWVIGYASTFSGNTWRDRVLEKYTKLAEEYKKAGLVERLIVTQSEGDVARTIQQMNQLLDQGVHAIITIGPSPTGINSAIQRAFDRGVPVINQDAPVTSPFAINTGVNYTKAGRQEAQWLVDEIGGEGNIIVVNGIPGVPSSEELRDGALEVFRPNPGINIVAQADGKWTNAIAKTEVLKVLSTNPGKIDGVHNQAVMGIGIIEALQQAGRPPVPVTVADAMAEAAFWRDNPDFVSKGFNIFPPADDAQLTWDVMARTLEGQGPIISSIIRTALEITFEDLKEIVSPDATTQSVEHMNVGTETWFPPETQALFFKDPLDPLEFNR